LHDLRIAFSKSRQWLLGFQKLEDLLRCRFSGIRRIAADRIVFRSWCLGFEFYDPAMPGFFISFAAQSPSMDHELPAGLSPDDASGFGLDFFDVGLDIFTADLDAKKSTAWGETEDVDAVD
jgi:hypothetical protein